MNFIDQTLIIAKAGNGGDGIVAFRKEKYVDKGGPNGGDGGHGGDVILKGDSNINTLQNLRFKQVFAAKPGGSGAKQDMHGADGEDRVIRVPVGTQIYVGDEENKKMFFIPRGFAHGFLVLSDYAEFAYKCTDFYHPNDEGGVIWNDDEIGIEWPIEEGMELTISDKDTKWGKLSCLKKQES